MGKSKISVIIAREFAIRVKKKSFILTTLLTPLLFAALMVVPGLIAAYSEEDEAHKIAVVDNSGVVMPYMQSDEQVEFCQVVGATVDNLKADFDKNGYFAVVGISALDSSKNVSVVTYSKKQLNMDIKGRISRNVEEAIEQHKLQGYGIPQLEEIMEDIESDVKVNTYTLDESGEEKVSKVEIFMVIGYIASFLIYMFIFMFGSMVMRSVIEEKTTRIIEVLVSSVKPFQIMMGKILGVALVAAVQIGVWGLLLILISGVILPSTMPTDLVANIEAVQSGADITAMAASGIDVEMATDLASLLDTAYIAKLVAMLILFMVGGFLLYAAMYAAIGASVDTQQDAQQLTTPVTIPIILAFIVTTLVMNDPNSPVVVWFSMIPFTAPIVMMARIPSGIPAWEIATSLVLLYITFIVMVWLAGKVYRVGIFMHGKKPTLKELYRWLKY